MYYELTCTCGAKHAVTVSQAGQSIHCPCGNSLAIPTLRGLKELPQVQTPATGTTRAIDQAPRGKPSVAIGVLVTTFFIALAAAIFVGYQRWTMDTSQTEESERQAAIEMFDQADATLLSEAWDQFSTTALGPPSKPAFYYVEKRRQKLESGLGLALGIALVSGLAAGAMAAGRRKT